jgi:tRNA/tmRNA/rRNA uracil-C5-methylase (TrmA/RlmC/RlmD family)
VSADAAELKAGFDKAAADLVEVKATADKATADAFEYQSQMSRMAEDMSAVQEQLLRERENLSQLSDQHAQLLRQQEVLATELMVALGNYKPKANIDAGELGRAVCGLHDQRFAGVCSVAC